MYLWVWECVVWREGEVGTSRYTCNLHSKQMSPPNTSTIPLAHIEQLWSGTKVYRNYGRKASVIFLGRPVTFCRSKPFVSTSDNEHNFCRIIWRLVRKTSHHVHKEPAHFPRSTPRAEIGRNWQVRGGIKQVLHPGVQIFARNLAATSNYYSPEGGHRISLILTAHQY